MRTHIPSPRRWRLLRPLLLSLILVSVVISYIFLKSRPDSELYRKFFRQEVENSRSSTRVDGDRKYVLFRQLQGAGFNNQVKLRGG